MDETAVEQQQSSVESGPPLGALPEASTPSPPPATFEGAGGGSTQAINDAIGHYADDATLSSATVDKSADAPKEKSWFDSVKDFGSSAVDKVKDFASPVTDTISTIQDKADQGLHSAEDWANSNIDKGEAAVTDAVAHSKDKDNWVGSLVNELGGVAGGVGKELVRMGGGLANMAVHPLDTAAGLYGMAEHNPMLGAPLKALHAGYDVLANGETMEGAAERLNPINSLKDDFDYAKNLAHGMVDPAIKSWEQGKYGEAIGQVGTQAFMMLGGGGASKAGEVAEAGEGAEAAEVARAAKAVQKKRVQMPAVENPYGPKPPGWEATPFPGPAQPGGPMPKPAELPPVTPSPAPIDPALAPTQPHPAFAPTQPAIPAAPPPAPVDPAFAPTQPAMPAAPPSKVDPLAPTQPQRIGPPDGGWKILDPKR